MENEKKWSDTEYKDGDVFAEEYLKMEDERVESLAEQAKNDHEEWSKNNEAGQVEGNVQEVVDINESDIRDNLEKINQAVQDSTYLSSEFGKEFGVDFKSDKAEADKWIEAKVAELEGKLSGTQEKQITELEVMMERVVKIDKVKRLLELINQAVQDSTYLSSEFGKEFGVDFKSDKAEADKWIEAKVAELEAELHELENINSGIEPPDSGLEPSQPTVEGLQQREEPTLSDEAVTVLQDTYEQQKESPERRSKWGWVKERIKGFATFGFWEVHQAERFRSNTNEVGEDITAKAEVLEQTRDLDIDVAQEEANRIREMVGGNEGMTREAIQQASEQIDADKSTYNTRVIDRISQQAREDIVARLEKYRDEFGASVVDEERLAAFEVGLRNSLLESTIGRGSRAENIEKNEIDFTKTIRERMDPKYWRRYVYGGVEAALMIAGFKLAVGKFFADGAGIGSVTEVAKVTGAVEKVASTDIPMKDTIWNTSKEWLTQHGVTNPSNQEIMNVSKQVAMDNHIGVREWGISGSPMDTNMQQGHLLNFKGAGTILKAISLARHLII